MLSEAVGKPAAIVSFLNGRWPKRPKPHHAYGVGAGLPVCTSQGRGSPARGIMTFPLRPGARFLNVAVRLRTGSHRDCLIPCSELDMLESGWPEALPRGVIHADLFPDNVFFVDQDLSGIIDFYFACNDAYAYDLAICLNAWCFEADGAFNITMARQMLSAYRAVRPLSRLEFDLASAAGTWRRNAVPAHASV